MWIVDNVDKCIKKSFLAKTVNSTVWKTIHNKNVDNVDNVDK